LSLLSWLASAYLIATAALQPLSGRLTDILSRRTGLIFSNVFFAAGNLICGLATKEWVMILGRVVAGMGGGGLTAISTFVASDLIPLRRRGVVQGIGNICFGLGSGLGGVFGGWVNDIWGWRKAFLVQVPLLVISGTLVFFTVNIPVKETSKSPLRRIDFLGALTLVLTLILLLLGLNSGGNIVPWTHPLVLTSLPLSAVFLLLFIYIEDRVASEPIIPVRLLLNRTVASACLTNWFLNMSIFALYFYTPIFFQLQGHSTTQAGARLIPQSIGGASGSLGSGLIMKSTGRYWWLNAGLQVLYVLSLSLVCTFNLTTPLWPPLLYFLMGGIGFGGMLTVTLLALISAVEHKDQAVVTSASYAFRSTGSTIGITIASAVYQNRLKEKLWHRFGQEKHAAEVIKRLRDSFDEIQRVPQGWKEGVVDSYMESLSAVFVTAFIMAVLGAVVSLFMREHVLHKNLARN
jgi:MFS family permease